MRAALLLLLASAACGLDADLAPLPRIVSVEPKGSGIDPTTVVGQIIFSEPVAADGLLDGKQLALVRRADAQAIAAAAARADGIAADAPVVAVAVALASDGRTALVRPAAPLDPDTGYAWVIGSHLHSTSNRPVLDPEGRARAWTVSFETGAAPDRTAPVPRWVEPPNGPAPANLRRLVIAFGEPVQGALALTTGPAGVSLQLAPDRLGLDLQAALGEVLAPSLAAVQDLAGNRAVGLAAMAVSPCPDATAPAPDLAGLTIGVGALSLRLATTVGELARLGVEIGVPFGEVACGQAPGAGGTVSRWGEVLACPGQDPCRPGAVQCPAAVEVSGLCPGTRYRLRVLAEDLAGLRATPGPWIETATAPGSAQPVLTEVLADAEAPGTAGEYVEVANLGTADADLDGWVLAKRTASGALSTCQIEVGSGGPIPPGGYALLTGGAYDGRYALPAGTTLYRCGARALIGGLANDRAPAIALRDLQGAVVSSFGMDQAATRCTGMSVERIDPSGSDRSANFGCASSAPGTPGACNGLTPAAECPSRPW